MPKHTGFALYPIFDRVLREFAERPATTPVQVPTMTKRERHKFNQAVRRAADEAIESVTSTDA